MTQNKPHKTKPGSLPNTRYRGLGWVPDLPDKRDFSLRSMPPYELPGKVDLRQYQSPVRDQGQLGSCVGFAVTGGVEYLRATDKDLFSTIYSPLYTYYRAREMQGWENYDSGAYIRDGVKSVTRIPPPDPDNPLPDIRGAVPETAWPYKPNGFTKAPTPSVAKKGTRWQLGSYHRCDVSSGLAVQSVMTALSKNWPVVGGFSCYASMFTPHVDQSGLIPMPSSNDWLVGGHAVLFVGYDMATAVFIFKNSWGVDWGMHGYGLLPFAYVHDRNLSDDFWAMSMESAESFQGRAPGDYHRGSRIKE